MMKEIQIDESLATNPDGSIKLCPLVGWQTAPVAGMALLVQVHYFPTQAAAAQGKPSSLQLGITPDECRRLGQQLLKMADQLSQPPKTGEPH